MPANGRWDLIRRLKVKPCVLCIAGTHKRGRESSKRDWKPHGSISATLTHVVSSPQFTDLYPHKATVVSETAFAPNCIIVQPEEKGLSIQVESLSQKNKDTLL